MSNSQKHNVLRFSIFFAILLCFAAGAFGGQIRTACEESGLEKYCNHAEMMQFLHKIQSGSNEMLLSTYGKSNQGRELVYAVFSRPMVTNPWEAMTSGKPIVMLDANVHGGERTLRESCLILIRELATKGTEMNKLLDKLVVIMAPCLNPDGTEKATRTNANGVDINRDYIKLDEPETRHYVRDMLQRWHPHLQVGGHNGGPYPYNQCYLATSNAAADPELALICDKEIFPLVNKNMEAGGYKSFYYGRGREAGFTVGKYSPRIFRNYGGLSNYVSIVFETGGGQATEAGIKSGVIAYKSILEYCSTNPKKLMGVVEKARRKTIEMGQKAQGQIAVQMKYVAEDYKVSYLAAERIRNNRSARRSDPNSLRARWSGLSEEEKASYRREWRQGRSSQRADSNSIERSTATRRRSRRDPNDSRSNRRRRYGAIREINDANIIKKPIATKTRPRPYAYVLEAKAQKVIDLLKRHNITVEVLQKDISLDIEAYVLKGIEHKRQHNHPKSTVVAVEEKAVRKTKKFPKGTYIVRTGQVMGRIITHMLEPETDDNVIVWNTMDDLLPEPGSNSLIPIYRITSPIKLPTMLSEECS